MFNPIAEFALTAGLYALVMVFGLGFLFAFGGRVIQRAFPVTPEDPEKERQREQRRAELRAQRLARAKARYEQETPGIFGIRWRFVVRNALNGSLFTLALILALGVQFMFLMLLTVPVSAVVTLHNFELPGDVALLFGLAFALPWLLFPRVRWGFVLQTVMREVLLIVGWWLALVYASAYYAAGDIRMVWGLGMVMGALAIVLGRDFFWFINRSHEQLEKAADRVISAIGQYQRLLDWLRHGICPR